MTVKKVVDIISEGYLDLRYFHWDEENGSFIEGDNLEYQVRDYSNGDFCSILVRFVDDETHSYLEFYDCSYDNIYDLLDDAMSDETIETLDKMVCDRLRKRGMEI